MNELKTPLIIIAIGGVLVYALTARGIFNQIFGESEEDRKLAKIQKRDIAAVKKQIEKLKQQGKKAYLRDDQIRMIAAGLYDALKVAGTDEDTIFKGLRYLSGEVDFLRCVVAFGIREGRDLIAWLRSDLTDSEKKTANMILRANNVSYSL